MLNIDNKKGYFFTIATIILMIPLIYLISFYSHISQTQMDDTIARIRCDELHYFVEDFDRDMERAVSIFGRRAAIYTINYTIETGKGLKDYEFTCTSQCGVNCSKFHFDTNGSEAAIGELILCGTIFGNNVTYMQNHTLSKWINMMKGYSRNRSFLMNIEVFEIKIVPMDAWHFALIIHNKISASDSSGSCSHTQETVTAMSNTSIIGLDDPVYPIMTGAKNMGSYIPKQFNNCSIQLNFSVIGSGQNGSGTAGGRIITYTDIGNTTPALCNFCSSASSDELEGLILQMDGNWGAGQCFNCPGDVNISSCFNSSSSKHFAGVIEYDSNYTKTLIKGCNITVPWIIGTGNLGLKSGDCVKIRNLDMGSNGCELHQVLNGTCSDKINTSCYSVSRVEDYNAMCPENYSNGPSFFDRLDGNLNLSEKYVEQAMEYFNTSDIGIESFIDIHELNNYIGSYNFTFNTSYSWVDYLYWQNISGCNVAGVCDINNITFRLDCQHSYSYEIDTNCYSSGTCPTEICINCIDDDYDGQVDWNDSDCSSFFSDGCGEVHYCDPTDSDTCNTCDTPMPPEIPDNSSNYCNYYGFSTTEWHFYKIVPDVTGCLYINFSSNVTPTVTPTSPYGSDLVFYNYLFNNCNNPKVVYEIESGSNPVANFFVIKNKEYIIALDIDMNCTSIQSYTLDTWIVRGGVGTC